MKLAEMTDTANKSKTCATADVALVVVHGIGEQLRGATLLDWADPIVQRLSFLSQRHGGHRTRVLQAELTGEIPANVWLSVEMADGTKRTIVISEARWADRIVAYKPQEVSGWALKFSFQALLRSAQHWKRTVSYPYHSWTKEFKNGLVELIESDTSFFSSLRNISRIIILILEILLRLLFGFVALVSTVAFLIVTWIIPAMAALVLVSLVVALKLPIISKKVQPIATALVSSVGDTAVWDRSHIQSAAIVQTVRDEVRRVQEHSKRVILLGHSQGAAVCAEAVLARNDPGVVTVDRLITVGAAISLLQRSGPEFRPVAEWAALPATNWMNFWSLWDPVSSGPIVDDPNDAKARWAECYPGRSVVNRNRTTGKTLGHNFLVPGPEERPVYNRSSIISDHSSYTSNVIQVIDPIARILIGMPDDIKPPSEKHSVDIDSEERAEIKRLYQHIVAVRELGAARIEAGLAALIFAVIAVSDTANTLWWTNIARFPLGIKNTSQIDEELLRFMPDLVYIVDFLVLAPVIYIIIIAIINVSWEWFHKSLNWSSPEYDRTSRLKSTVFRGTRACLLAFSVAFIIQVRDPNTDGTSNYIPISFIIDAQIVIAVIIGVLLMYRVPWAASTALYLPERREYVPLSIERMQSHASADRESLPLKYPPGTAEKALTISYLCHLPLFVLGTISSWVFHGVDVVFIFAYFLVYLITYVDILKKHSKLTEMMLMPVLSRTYMRKLSGNLYTWFLFILALVCLWVPAIENVGFRAAGALLLINCCIVRILYRKTVQRAMATSGAAGQGVADLQDELWLLVEAGAFQTALEVATELKALDPEARDPDELAARARLATLYTRNRQAVEAGDVDVAGQAIVEILRTDPVFRDAWRRLAERRGITGEPSPQTQHGEPVPSNPSGLGPTVPDPGPVSGTEVMKMQHNKAVTSVVFSPDGTRLLTGGWDKTARIWNPTTGSQILTIKVKGFTTSVNAVAFSQDGTRLATGSEDGIAQIWDATTGARLRGFRHEDSSVQAVAFSTDGTRLATGGANGITRIWDVATGARLLEFRQDGTVHGVALSPDSGRLATAGGPARIWDTTTGEKLLQIRHDGLSMAVAFSPDGTRLATGTGDCTARIRDTTTGRELMQFRHDRIVSSVAFSPEGTRLATGSWDQTARIWDADTGKQLRRIPHGDLVRAVAFNPDGTLLATGSGNTARIWAV